MPPGYALRRASFGMHLSLAVDGVGGKAIEPAQHVHPKT